MMYREKEESVFNIVCSSSRYVPILTAAGSKVYLKHPLRQQLRSRPKLREIVNKCEVNDTRFFAKHCAAFSCEYDIINNPAWALIMDGNNTMLCSC